MLLNMQYSSSLTCAGSEIVVLVSMCSWDLEMRARGPNVSSTRGKQRQRNPGELESLERFWGTARCLRKLDTSCFSCLPLKSHCFTGTRVEGCETFVSFWTSPPSLQTCDAERGVAKRRRGRQTVCFSLVKLL